ncbi:MAG: hypothetical protein IIY21_21035 [Clostridiales bacterium]|nr:hypothetical protein [Clostridiales bacterium]MBQ1571255.1 hypothetical protein [Clostridiales bacterium]
MTKHDIGKRLKQIFCAHDFYESGTDYFRGCVCAKYFKCRKCGKLIVERWQ